LTEKIEESAMTDPWSQTITMLNAFRSEAPVIRPSSFQRKPLLHEAFDAALVVNVLERPSSTTATISWRDATRCSYGDQTWRTSRSRKSGICAMSGRAIVPGDVVYRPSRRSAPCNAHAMILASVLEDKLAA
jgi:hypothetical protein